MRNTLIGYLFILCAVILSGCAHNAAVLEEPPQPSLEAKASQSEEKPLEFVELGQGIWLQTGYRVVMPWESGGS